MARILVTGMSGTGKSTALAELGRRGHRVIDTDYGGWSEEIDSGSGPEQLWRADLVDALLAEPGSMIVAGCVSNQGQFYDRFDAIVLLSLPIDVLLDRIKSRRTNPFGKAAAERVRILRDLERVEPLLRETSTVEIATTRPLDDVVDEIETLVR